MNKIKWKLNEMPKDSDKTNQLDFLNKEEIEKAKGFHMSFPQYKETPLVCLNSLASEVGLGGIYIKDESHRFGLNAFKVLGGSYAMAKYMAEKLGEDISSLGYDRLVSDDVRRRLGEITFVTATDGNHGKGIAWTARKLKQKSVVYMPKGSTVARLESIRKEGADACITDLNYDDAVRLANEYAEKNNGVTVQDTAWEGYEKIPAHIMQGYGTMALEALEQLNTLGVKMPTHIFVQAGVGSFAGAVQGFFASCFTDEPPITVVVESDLADCHYKSAVANDGKPRIVDGDMQTIMAGLACGEPSIISFNVLKNFTTAFASCPDWVAANGMRILSSPLKGDERIISGESGAVTLGLLYEIMTNSLYSELKDKLGLNKSSNILLFSTEGDTDPEMYKRIVWQGKNEKY